MNAVASLYAGHTALTTIDVFSYPDWCVFEVACIISPAFFVIKVGEQMRAARKKLLPTVHLLLGMGSIYLVESEILFHRPRGEENLPRTCDHKKEPI